MLASIFLEFNLPNATTWFYFALLLALAMFVRYDRFFSLRNWDILTLFLMVPGFLLLIEGHVLITHAETKVRGDSRLLFGYIWLISVSFYWFMRCVLDLGLERRPALAPNLNLAGLSAFAVVLFISMTTVAVRRMPDEPQPVGKGSIVLERIQQGTTSIVNYQKGIPDLEKADTRFWVERSVAMVLHLTVLGALIAICIVHFQDATAGVASACLYLLMPMTAYHISQVHHVWPAVFLCWAIFTYRRPILTGLLLGIAAGSVFFPLLLFPLWFGFYRGRGAWRFTFGFLFSTGFSLFLTALLLLSEGEFFQHLNIALSLSDWQAWKVPKTEGIWTGSHWAYRMPVFIVYMAFVILTIFWPSPRNLGQVIAQTAAVVIGVQFWYADQGGVYVLWYLPLLLLMIFRPNLLDRRPPAIQRETDWLWSFLARVRKWTRRLSRSKPTNALSGQRSLIG